MKTPRPMYHLLNPLLCRKDDDKKDKPERKKKAPKQQQPRTSTSKEEEGWTTVSGVDKVAKVTDL